MILSLMLNAKRDAMWELALQMGVTGAVTNLRDSASGPEPQWEFLPLLHTKQRYEDAGFRLLVVEGNPVPMDKIRLGLPGRDEEIEIFCTLLRNMGAIGIPILCYNFMARIGWFRTSVTTPGRGGALASSFRYADIERAPETDVGRVSVEQLWENFEYFLKRVVPVAESANVKLALHPDDPPVTPVRGIARIFTNPSAFERAIDLVPSPNNGIAFCQANFSAMGANIPETAKRLGANGKIFFVHLRNILSNGSDFVETFHDEGQIDMVAALRAYHSIGFDGPIRPDHVPTMHGEENARPGYENLGRLFAVGYMKGIMESLGIPDGSKRVTG